MPRPSQKPAMLAAALSCFAERGYDATRVRHISDRAGVAESALYRHYPSKEAIAQELYQGFIGRYADALTVIAEAGGAPLGQLRAVVRLVLDTYRAEPEAFVFAVLNTRSYLPALPPGSVYPLDIIESIVARAQRERVVRSGQTNLLAAIFLGATLQPIVLATLSRPGAFDLLHEPRHDAVIEQAALAAIRRHPA